MLRSLVWISLIGATWGSTWPLPKSNARPDIPNDGIAKSSEIDDKHAQQAKAVAAILDLGGEIVFRNNDPKQSVVAVNLNHPRRPLTPNSLIPRLTPKDLTHLSCFPHLQRLQLWGYWITSAHLAKLSNLLELDCLELFWATISDDDLKYLQNMTALRELHLNRCHSITDEGMKHLRKMVNLEILNLDMTKVSGSGLGELKPVIHLKELSLRSCDNINDQAVRQLEKFKQLEIVNLYGNELTDKCLDSLKRIPNLRTVCLQSTEISRDGAAAFRKACPNTKIYIDSGE